MPSSSTATTASEQRLIADNRQFGGLILVLGVCSMFGALVGVASGAGRDGGTPSENGIPLWSFIGACCQAFFGALAILVGYLQLITDTGHAHLTLSLIVAIQLAWIPYVTAMASIGKQASNMEAQMLIPPELSPTVEEVQFVAFVGVVTVLAHGFAYIGSLAFTSFALYTYQTQQYQERAAEYYHGRLIMYCVPVILAGFTQLSLGAYCFTKYGSGPYEQPINVAVYTIFFPGISVLVGFIQLLTGFVGVARFAWWNMWKFMGGIWSFQVLCGCMWLSMMVLQLMVQVGFAPKDQFAAAAPTRACLFFGFCVMPAYLDYKWRNTPRIIEEDYYGFYDAVSNKEDLYALNDTFQDEDANTGVNTSQEEESVEVTSMY